ncbi:MAG: BON domain-containing protein [Burkholderiaceae bacterium]|nr:BON domain-containing protein [Burkholderiaceae bacterium]
MKSDAQLKADVSRELEWDTSINSANVGVAVNNGIVTLSGHLDTYAEKYAIERAVQRVEGVKAVAVELDVKLAPDHKRSDSEIAQAIETAFKWHVFVPADRVHVKVEKGWVTLSGEVEWEYQRSASEKTVRPLTGVLGVTNQITLKAQIPPTDIKNRITEALKRHAEREARNVEVTVNGSVVTLRGKVDSWTERMAAQGATWSAPGITKVVNELRVGV